MKTRLDPTVLDQARDQLGFKSDEKLGAKLGRSGHTVRQWRKGNSTPTVADLVKLQFLTGRPYGTMLLLPERTEAA